MSQPESGDVTLFEGHVNPGRHHSTGRRAWCHCNEWCYPAIDMACSCCRAEMADESPCPHCDGTGIRKEEEE